MDGQSAEPVIELPGRVELESQLKKVNDPTGICFEELSGYYGQTMSLQRIVSIMQDVGLCYVARRSQEDLPQARAIKEWNMLAPQVLNALINSKALRGVVLRQL